MESMLVQTETLPAGARLFVLPCSRPARPNASGSVGRSPDHGGELYAFSDGELTVQELSVAPRRRERRYCICQPRGGEL